MHRCLSFFSFCFAAASAFGGATIAWKGGSGSVSDAANWNGGVLPVKGDVANIAVAQDAVVTYPAGTWTNAFPVFYQVASGHELTVDGTGSSFVMPDFEEGDNTWPGEPLKFLGDGGAPLLKLENWWGEKKSRGLARFDDFRFRIDCKNGAADLHFDKGTFDFLSPNGTKLTTRLTLSGYDYNKPVHIVFHDGTTSKWPGLAPNSFGVEDVLRFAGGTHEIDGAFYFPYEGSRSRADGEQRVEAVNGGKLTVKGSSVGFNVGCNPEKAGRTYRFLAADGGTFELAGTTTFSTMNAGTAVLAATNGGTFCASCPLALGTAKDSTITTRVEVADATWRSTASVSLGAATALGPTTFDAARSTVEAAAFYLYGSEANPVKVRLVDSSWQALDDLRLLGAAAAFSATDSTLAFSNVIVSVASGAPAQLTLKDCTVDQYGYFAVGHAGSGAMTIDGGTQDFMAVRVDPRPSVNGSGISVGWVVGGGYANGDGTLYLTGTNRVTTFRTQGSEFYIANEATSTGRVIQDAGTTHVRGDMWLSSQGKMSDLVISGGVFQCYANLNLARGNAAVTVAGGRLVSPRFTLGAAGGAKSPVHTFTLEGGEAWIDSAVLVANNATVTGVVSLVGGVLAAGGLEGGSAAACRGGTGAAFVSADGGTIRARWENAGFIRNCDRFELGAKGLTIDTDYAVTVAQDFVSKAGVAGKLVKKGSGTLTLSGALADDVTVEVLDGTVVFAASQTIGALVVGGADSAGAVEIAAGKTLAVKGDVTIVHDASNSDLVLVKDPETGVTTVSVDASDPVSLELRLDAGTSNATEAISFKRSDTLVATVGAQADLTLSGTAARGALVKKGPGALHVADAGHEFLGGVTAEGGLVEAANAQTFALGWTAAPALTQKDGTLAFGAGDATVRVKPVFEAATKTNALVVRAADAVTFANGLSVKAGALVKTGAGSVVVDAVDGESYATGNGCNRLSYTPSYAAPVRFDAFGTAPQDGYAGFNVAEGDWTFRGTGAESIFVQCGLMVGLYSESVAAPPSLTFDNVYADLKTSGHLTFFGANHRCKDFTARPKVRIVNGAYVRTDTLAFGTYSTGPVEAELLVDDATLCNVYAFYAGYLVSSTAQHLTVTLTNNATFYTSGETTTREQGLSRWIARTDLDAWDSVFAGTKTLRGARLGIDQMAYATGDLGTWTFHRGAKFYLERFDTLPYDVHWTVCFDGGEFDVTTNAFSVYHPDKLTFTTTANGVTMPVAAEKSVEMYQQVGGAGAIVKTGAGALVFGKQGGTAPTLCTAGGLDLREGTCSLLAGSAADGAACALAAGTTLAVEKGAGALALSGSGTVTGTLDDATIPLPADADSALTFACDNAGTTWVDWSAFDWGDTLPKNVLVAKKTTGALGRWRAKGLGDDALLARFSLVDGEVRADVVRCGTVLVVR